MAPPRDVMMAVPEDKAIHLLEIEALRQITDNLKGLNSKMDDQGKAIHGIDVRLARIESNRIDDDVSALGGRVDRLCDRVDALETDKDRRDGALGAWDRLVKSWPTLVGVIVIIVTVLLANGRLPL